MSSTSRRVPAGPWVVEQRAPSLVDDGRVLSGTSAAIARWLQVDPLLVRLAFVVLTVAGGWGIVLYLACWIGCANVGVPPPAAAEVDTSVGRDRTLGFGLVVLGLLFQARIVGVGFSDSLVWPTAVIAVGVAVAARRVGEREVRDALGGGRGVAARVLAGTVLLLVGLAALVGTDLSWSSLVRTVLSVTVVLVGVSVMFGPTLRGLATALGDERSRRIRSDERARISAHLHDSVLQTLALVQKRAGDPTEIASLARRQERELRSWLYGGHEAVAGTLRSALDDVVAEVEERHRVAVECVVVGDTPLTPSVAELVAAAREAAVNAAKFSGEQHVSVYAEARDGEAEVYIRDRGVGFDPRHVSADRRGLADSVIGRMRRVGGSATVRSAPGEGVEVRLQLPAGGR